MTEPQQKVQDAQEGELFRLLVNNVKDYAIFVIDPEGRVQSWNPGAERLLGYRQDEIIGKSIEAFFTPDDIKNGVPLREMRESLEEGRGNDDRWQVRKDGSRFWAGGVMTPLRDEHASIRGFAKIMRDRTEWKLVQEQERFESRLLDMVGQAAIATEPDGTILYWNRFAETLYGWARAEVIGRNIVEIIGPHGETFNAAEIVSQLQAGRNWSGEFLVQSKDGRTFPAQITNSAIFDDKGKLQAIIGVSSDITERKQKEAELARKSEESEQQRRIYEAALSNTADFNYVFDLRGRFKYVNKALLELWQKDLSEAAGKNFFELDYEPGLAAQLQSQIQLVIDTKKPLRDETPYTSVVGERQYEYIFVPIIGTDGEVEAVAGSTRDVTEGKILQWQLSDARRRLEEALAAGETATWIWDIPEDRVYADETLAKWFFVSSQEAAGGPLARYLSAIHSDDRSRVSAIIAKAVEEGGNYEADYRISREGEPSRWVAARGRVEQDGNGAPARMAGVLVDISARKRAEAALAESEEKFRHLANTIPQLAWMAKPDGHVFWYNCRWYDYTGTTSEQMEGWGWQSVHDPLVLPIVMERWNASIANGQPFDMVFPLKGADGLFRPFLTRINPLRDEAGHILYWFGTNTDISESKRAEDASRFLADASASLAAVEDYNDTLEKVARMAVPFFADWCVIDMADADGSLRRLVTVHADSSKSQLIEQLRTRYPIRSDDAFGPQKVFRTVEPEMASDITDSLLKAMAQDSDHLNLLLDLGLRSYVCVPLLSRNKALGVLTFITSESGRRYGSADLALAKDLASRAAIAIDNALLYAELRETDRRKDEFLATLAHELRNPLAPIRNSLQILKMPRVDANTIEQCKDVIERQLHQLVRLVDDLLDVSRVMRGKIDLRKENLDLTSVVTRSIETTQPLIDTKKHEVRLHLSTETLLIYADPVRLAQIVGNLLNNAAKYTDAKGHIWITTERAGDEAVLRIRDDGIGIAPDMLPKIFDLFVQVDHAATHSQGGLGIGLTLAKNLVEMHGGRVEARSSGLGQGCEFVIWLPLAGALAQDADGTIDNDFRQSKSISFSRLMVVDDNVDAAISLAVLLRLHGHEVQVAHRGEAALEIAASFRPAMMFLDIGMPGLSGYDVAQRIRQIPGMEKLILVALTGWGQAGDRRKTAQAGFDHHLVKPPDAKALEKLLAELNP